MGKRFVFGAIAVGFVLLSVAVVVLLSPFSRPPAIARGCEGNIAQEDQCFKERVYSAFPLETDENDLIEILRAQGFQQSAQRRNMVYDFSRFPCVHKWLVSWAVEDSQITNLFALRGATCL